MKWNQGILLTCIAGLLLLQSCDERWKDMIGTKWTLTSIHTEHGQRLKPQAYYTMQIEADQLLIKLDINSCRYAYEIKEKDQIEIAEAGICTRACCDSDMAKSFTKKLAGLKTVKISKDEIILTGKDTLYFRPWSEKDVKRVEEQSYLKIRRTGCFGTCPIYEMTLFEDGHAEYYGRRFVAVEGAAEHDFDTDRIAQLMKQAKRIDFKSLPKAYENPQISDSESVFVEYNGDTIKIRERRDVPEPLLDLMNEIHQCAVDAGWVEK